ncbi:Flagellar biosynthesis protein FliO [Nitrincola lacisaponensis]|uniref:Flagellar protein n=1 Tax=Nitrincola lacisaponensis TaxID=267850 RepID=A0A063Y4A1_9GAMM|nr:flagellar biosynthetic protein FliO [Nitrincola lacisaponensis]KDE39596.1 Flagellar biosynthesis protein FliO [Nitrincola lacisaponensis]
MIYRGLLLLCLFSSAAWGEERRVSVSAYRSADPLSLESVLQLLLGLGLVLGTIFLIAWLLRRVTLIPGQHRKLKVIAALSLGQRERAVLVQVGEQQVLLGVAQGQVTLLKSFEQPVIQPEAPAETAFSRTLGQYLHKRNNNDAL